MALLAMDWEWANSYTDTSHYYARQLLITKVMSVPGREPSEWSSDAKFRNLDRPMYSSRPHLTM